MNLRDAKAHIGSRLKSASKGEGSITGTAVDVAPTMALLFSQEALCHPGKEVSIRGRLAGFKLSDPEPVRTALIDYIAGYVELLAKEISLLGFHFDGDKIVYTRSVYPS